MKPFEKEKRKKDSEGFFKSWGKDSHKNSQLISFFFFFSLKKGMGIGQPKA